LLHGTRAAGAEPSIGRFAVDGSLNLQRVSGAITHYLGCEPADLLGFGWRPFLVRPDQPDLARMAGDVGVARAGRYDLVAQARVGDPILHLRLRTYLVRSAGAPPEAGGRIDLRHVELRRAIVIP
jgi:hypothetical protein